MAVASLVAPASAQRDAADDLARAYVSALRDGDVPFAVSLFAPTDTARDTATLRGPLQAVADSLRQIAEPLAMTLVNRQRSPAIGAPITHLMYQLDTTFPAPFISVALRELKSGPEIVGVSWGRFNATPEAQSFRFEAGSAAGFAALIVAACLAVFSIGTAVLVLRTPMPRRGWWAFVALLGAGQVVVAWEGGQFETHLLMVQLFCAGVVRLGPGPWVVQFAFPVGALIALTRRQQFQRLQRERLDGAQAEPVEPIVTADASAP